MAQVVWDRRREISDAKETIKYVPKGSRENFKPPRTIESDFTRLLRHDVPHVNWTFELVHNWYECVTQTQESLAKLSQRERKAMYKDGTRYIRIGNEDEDSVYYALDQNGDYELTEDYQPIYIRAQQTAIDWKSKIGNSDMSTNFKTDYTVPVQKGDYAIREDGALYMLNWNITLHANNQATQSIECNAVVDITREFPDETDEKGFLIAEGGRRPIAKQLPISHSEYAGRPDYSGASMQAGMHPDHLISIYCQWNPITRKIRLDDELILGDFTYRIINVSLAEVQIDKDYGVLTLNAKRVAGGAVNGRE